MAIDSIDYSSIEESSRDALGDLEPIEGNENVRKAKPQADTSGMKNESIESTDAFGVASFDKFAALDIRVSKILEADDVAGAKKPLYKLRVDLGEELGVRTIVAGIAAYYSKDELVNRKIIVVANLAPRSIAGIMSQGMLLAAEDGDAVSLLQPDRDMKVGSKIG